MSETRLLEEQQRYYSARAPEYDQWWLRRGRYDLGPEGNRAWFREVAQVRDVFEAAPLGGEVLELAGGTGIWTEMLAARATQLTVLDGAEEMLAINAERLSRAGLRDKVRYRQTDLFTWSPTRQYDTVFFGFWLSHVPVSLLDGFLQKVAAALRVGGRLAIVDSRADDESRRKQGTERLDHEHERREINDGRIFRIVKRYEAPTQLEQRLTACGIRARVQTTDLHLLYALGQREDDGG